jgi:serine/threonine protein phosphatase PrpC
MRAAVNDAAHDLPSRILGLPPSCGKKLPPMRIRYAAKTDPGLKRNHNEDYFSLIEDEQLFLVADGMGGHACGEVASKMAADVIREFFGRTKEDDSTWPFKMDRQLSYLENRLVVGIKLANQRIFEAAAKDARLKGMGTTVVIGMIAGDKLYIAHVGDSRLYRIRGNEVQQLTRDHSLLEDYKDARPDMSDEEQRKFPHKNVITRALGMRETVQVDVAADDIQDGDVFVLCSDGLSGMIDNKKLVDTVSKSGDLEHAVTGLVDAANQAGGTDNITVLALECHLN